jgi:hypothetical protein
VKQSEAQQSHAMAASVTAEVKGKYVLRTRERVTDKLVAGQMIPSHCPPPHGNYAIVYI